MKMLLSMYLIMIYGQSLHAEVAKGTKPEIPARPRYVIQPVGTCPSGGQPSSNEPLPHVDSQFHTRVEGKEIVDGKPKMAMDFVQFVDYDNNRASIFWTKDGSNAIDIYDFKEYKDFDIYGGHCNTWDIRHAQNDYFNFSVGSNGGHISPINELFYLDKAKYNTTFVKNDVVRGLQVKHWSSCFLTQTRMFYLNIYYSSDNFPMPSGKKSVPVRISINVTSRDNNPFPQHDQYLYDYVFYRPGPIQLASAFQIPHGVVCTDYASSENHILPHIPDNFVMSVESINAHKEIQIITEYFDWQAKLLRIDMIPSEHSIYRHPFGKKKLKIIHDYSTGLEYVIEKRRKNCTVRPIPVESDDALPLNNKSDKITMKHGSMLFDINRNALHYQGKRMVRDISCDIWAMNKPGWPKGYNSSIEFQFTQRNWSCDGDLEGARHGQALVGITVTCQSSKEPKDRMTYVNHMFGLCAERSEISTYDIQTCYPKAHDSIHFSFMMQGADLSESLKDDNSTGPIISDVGKVMQISPPVQRAIATAANISSIRVSNLEFEVFEVNKLGVRGILLREPRKMGPVENHNPQINLTKAFDNLKKKANSGMNMEINIGNLKKQLTVVPNSVMSDDELMGKSEATHKGASYTKGSMAWMGICMLLLGVAVGSVFGYFKWRRGYLGFLYQRH